MKATILLPLFCTAAIAAAQAQTTYTAYTVPSGTVGNLHGEGLGVGSDFTVLSPITVSRLGVFDSGGDGIQGSAILTAQLYERNAASATLLESVTFDTVNPGVLVDGSRFKMLVVPVTLLPGQYSIVAYGFDRLNPLAEAGDGTGWALDTGGGAVRFEHASRSALVEPNSFPATVVTNSSFHFAAGTFVFAGATLSPPPYADHYGDLTAGVQAFPLEDERHLGSLIVWSDCAFPLIVEPGGNRQVMAAASTCPTNGARAVAFAHVQWGRIEGDARMQLFENAIRWASRKSNPADIIIGLGPRLNTNYFVSKGYQVRSYEPWMTSSDDVFPDCDVVVADWSIDYASRVQNRIEMHVRRGKGLVVTTTPQLLIYRHVRSAFGRLNTVLEPFGLAYRRVLAVPANLGFTNISASPYPVYFSALSAAALLRQDRLGQVRLDSLARSIALNTINYSSIGRPELLSVLTSVYGAGSAAPPAVAPDKIVFADVVQLTAGQASSNRLGNWLLTRDGGLIALDRRGSLEYEFDAPAADLYRVRIEGGAYSVDSSNKFPLILSVDGQNLGRRVLLTSQQIDSAVEWWTPYLARGPHRLRLFWDGGADPGLLRLKNIRVQVGPGSDENGNGIKDWVDTLVRAQSGLDQTNGLISSLTSPACLEGRDPYPWLIQALLMGADNQTCSLSPVGTSDGRWYINAPLSAYSDSQVSLQITYQNGALAETRALRWEQLNLLQATNMTIRKGDSLLFNALPEGDVNGSLTVAIGENLLTGSTLQPIAWQFTNTGIYTVTGTCEPPHGPPQTGSVLVNVVGQELIGKPVCWTGMQRTWDVPAVPPEVALESDARLFCTWTASLPDNGIRLSLLTDRNEPRSVVARLGRAGPILDETQARGFSLWSGGQTYTLILKEYPDGSQLVEVLLISSPVLPDVTFRIYTIVGGVIFEDGTTDKTLTAADFDSLGMHKLRFIRPAAARTSVCHSIKAFQGSTLIGYLR